MGKAIDFEERNDFIGKPKDMSDNQCYALPVCRIITHIQGETDKDPAVKVPAHVSCWQLSEEERAEVARTGKVYAKIIGHTLFPMSIHGIKPLYTGPGQMADVIISKEEINN